LKFIDLIGGNKVTKKNEAGQQVRREWTTPEVVDLDLSMESVKATVGPFDDGVTAGIQPSS
jgi:hypothetical protein